MYWFFAKRLALLGLVLGLWTAAQQPANADIKWRLSIKLILDQDGNRPPIGNLNDPTKIRDSVKLCNERLLRLGRGVSFDLVDDVIEMRDPGGFFDGENNAARQFLLDRAAKLNPSAFHWRDDAINLYINGSTNGVGGNGPFPGSGVDAILMGQAVSQTTILHECGHFFGLCHTHGCLASGCDSEGDDISDTMADSACWTRNDLSLVNFFPPLPYAARPPEIQQQIDDAFRNFMSYHEEDNRYYLSPQQLDRMADNSNFLRSNVASGVIRFVDYASNCTLHDGSPWCSGPDVSGPYVRLHDAVNFASVFGNDMVLVAQGTYMTQTLFTKPMVIRSWRGKVTIRAP